jgi:hypothetical protein
LGFSLFGGAPPYLEGGCTESSSPRKDTSCEGSGFFVRCGGEADRERDIDRVRRARLDGGEADAEGERVRCLRERRASFDLSLRFVSRDRERSCRRCLSLEPSRFSLRTKPLSFDRSRCLSFEWSRRLSPERSRRRSLERLLFRSTDLSRLPSFSRRRSRERSLLWSRDPSPFLSLDASRGFRYGSGERCRTGALAAAGGTASRVRSRDSSRGRSGGATKGTFRACSGPFLEARSRLPLLLSLGCGVPFLSAASFCVRSLRALNGDRSLAILQPLSRCD